MLRWNETLNIICLDRMAEYQAILWLVHMLMDANVHKVMSTDLSLTVGVQLSHSGPSVLTQSENQGSFTSSSFVFKLGHKAKRWFLHYTQDWNPVSVSSCPAQIWPLVLFLLKTLRTVNGRLKLCASAEEMLSTFFSFVLGWRQAGFPYSCQLN